VFLAAMGADETKIEASFCEAIRIAMEQKSISLAEETRRSNLRGIPEAKKRAGQEDVDSGYPFDDVCSALPFTQLNKTR
jgi:hypothetical protein